MHESKPGLFAVLILFCISLVTYAENNLPALDKPGLRLVAPDFSLPMLSPILENRDFKLSDLKGKLVIINFWSLDCAPCLDEMSSLNRLLLEYKKDGLRVVTVSINNTITEISSYQSEKKWSFIMLTDPDRKVRNLYEIKVIPTSYIIGRDGRFTGRIIGKRDWFSIDMRKTIEANLKAG